MFGTLLYNSEAKEPLFIENKDPSTAINRNRVDRISHIACGSCRSRKLRCSGQPSGCDRCKSVSAACVYPREVEAKRSKRTSPAAGNLTPQTLKKRHSTSGGSRNLSAEAAGADMPGQKESQPENTAGPKYLPEQYSVEVNMAWDETGILGIPGDFDDVSGTSTSTNPRGAKLSTPGLDWDWGELMMSPSAVLSPAEPVCVSPKATTAHTGHGQQARPYRSPTQDAMERRSAGGERGFIPGPNSPGLSESTSHDSAVDVALIFTPASSRGSHSIDLYSTSSRQTEKGAPLRQQNEGGEDGRINTRLADSAESPPEVCTCLRQSACLLEKLGCSVGTAESQDIDVLLQCSRKALQSYDSVLSCQVCSIRSENVMLLSMAGQYLSIIFSKMVSACEDPGGLADDVNNSGGSSKVQQQAQGGEMWFRSYRVETAAERRQAVTCIVMVQLMDLCRLLGQLKVLSGNSKAALAPLLRAEERVVEIRRRLLACGSALWTEPGRTGSVHRTGREQRYLTRAHT